MISPYDMGWCVLFLVDHGLFDSDMIVQLFLPAFYYFLHFSDGERILRFDLSFLMLVGLGSVSLDVYELDGAVCVEYLEVDP